MPDKRGYKAFAEFYDAEYADSPLLAADVPFLFDHLPRRHQSILELAVGTARAAIPLAQAGHRVVGVDYDPAMLDIARRKRAAVGLTGDQLSLVHQDAMNLRLDQQFDWVVILFNTFLNFTTLQRQDAVLSRAVAHLKPAGRLWIDIFNPNLDLLAKPRSEGLDPTLFHVPSLDRTVLRTTDLRIDPANQIQKVTFRYQWFDARGLPCKATLRFELTWLFPRELRILLERHGLVIDRLHGNYDASEVTPASPRLIALAKKRA